MLDHMAILFLAFGRTSILFSIVVIPMHIPTNCVGGFQKGSNLIHRFSCAGAGEAGKQREQQVKAENNAATFFKAVGLPSTHSLGSRCRRYLEACIFF